MTKINFRYKKQVFLIGPRVLSNSYRVPENKVHTYIQLATKVHQFALKVHDTQAVIFGGASAVIDKCHVDCHRQCLKWTVINSPATSEAGARHSAGAI
jgi:hypothetical protein